MSTLQTSNLRSQVTPVPPPNLNNNQGEPNESNTTIRVPSNDIADTPPPLTATPSITSNIPLSSTSQINSVDATPSGSTDNSSIAGKASETVSVERTTQPSTIITPAITSKDMIKQRTNGSSAPIDKHKKPLLDFATIFQDMIYEIQWKIIKLWYNSSVDKAANVSIQSLTSKLVYIPNSSSNSCIAELIMFQFFVNEATLNRDKLVLRGDRTQIPLYGGFGQRLVLFISEHNLRIPRVRVENMDDLGFTVISFIRSVDRLVVTDDVLKRLIELGSQEYLNQLDELVMTDTKWINYFVQYPTFFHYLRIVRIKAKMTFIETYITFFKSFSENTRVKGSRPVVMVDVHLDDTTAVDRLAEVPQDLNIKIEFNIVQKRRIAKDNDHKMITLFNKLGANNLHSICIEVGLPSFPMKEFNKYLQLRVLTLKGRWKINGELKFLQLESLTLSHVSVAYFGDVGCRTLTCERCHISCKQFPTNVRTLTLTACHLDTLNMPEYIEVVNIQIGKKFKFPEIDTLARLRSLTLHAKLIQNRRIQLPNSITALNMDVKDACEFNLPEQLGCLRERYRYRSRYPDTLTQMELKLFSGTATIHLPEQVKELTIDTADRSNLTVQLRESEHLKKLVLKGDAHSVFVRVYTPTINFKTMGDSQARNQVNFEVSNTDKVPSAPYRGYW